MTRVIQDHGVTQHRLRVQFGFIESFHKSEALALLRKAEDAIEPVARLDGAQWVLRDGSIHDAVYLAAGNTAEEACRVVLREFDRAVALDGDLKRLRIAVHPVGS